MGSVGFIYANAAFFHSGGSAKCSLLKAFQMFLNLVSKHKFIAMSLCVTIAKLFILAASYMF